MQQLKIKLRSIVAFIYEEAFDLESSLRPCLFTITDKSGELRTIQLKNPVVDLDELELTYDVSDIGVEGMEIDSVDVMVSFTSGSIFSSRWEFGDATVCLSDKEIDVMVYSKFYFREYCKQIGRVLRGWIGDIDEDGFEVCMNSELYGKRKRRCFESYFTGALSMKLEEAVEYCLLDRLSMVKVKEVCGLTRKQLLELV
ncbi:hypothetical protein F7U66_01685 [Vibrio parahaemolyticus]|nr:hypothetical protein [Vibrio parahaemolyticus]